MNNATAAPLPLAAGATTAGPRPAAGAPSRAALAAAGLAFSIIWSSAFVAGKVGLHYAGPLTILAMRFLAAGLLLAAVCALQGRRLGGMTLPGRTLVAGVLYNAVYLGLAYWGMQATPAALTSILVSTCPLLTLLFAALIGGERLTSAKILGVGLGLTGVVWITQHRLAVDHLDPLSLAAILAGTLALALGTVLTKRVAGSQDMLVAVTLQMLCSGLVLLLPAWGWEGLRFENAAGLWWSLAYSAGVASLGTTLLMFWMLRHGQAGTASSFHFLNPFFGTLFAVVLLGEPLYASDLLGVVPIAVGIVLVARGSGNGRPRTAPGTRPD